MKRKYLFLTLVLIILVMPLAACGSDAADSPNDSILTIGEKTYTPAKLKQLAMVEATFNDITYVGVPVADLLADAGYDLASLLAVKAVAADGYTVNYEPDQLNPANVIVAYAQADGALTADDGNFRMVLPDQEGNMNLRMLVELQAVE